MDNKQIALQHHATGMGIREISRLLGVNASTVSRWIKNATPMQHLPTVQHPATPTVDMSMDKCGQAEEYLHPWYMGDTVPKDKYGKLLKQSVQLKQDIKSMTQERDFYLAGADPNTALQSLLDTLDSQNVLEKAPSLDELIQAIAALCAPYDPHGNTWEDNTPKWANTRSYLLVELKRMIAYIVSQRE